MDATLYCNAPLQSRNRKGKFCKKVAGEGTDHYGEGHCHLHGGNISKPGEGVKAYAGVLEVAAAKLHDEDLEQLMQMSNKGLVLARAMAVQRLVTPGISSREANDLSMAISRLDKLIDNLPQGEDDPDSPANTGPDAVDAEAARLAQLLNG